MTFQSTRFDMSGVMNRLRAIAEDGGENTFHHDPGMEAGGKEIDNASFTRTMQRLSSIKDAVAEEHFNALKAGIRAMYMNRRPNLQQMSALMDLLETVLAYVAEDTALFQRLKADLAKGEKKEKDEADKEEETPPPEEDKDDEDEPKLAGAPETQKPPAMRELK
jgi:hypothetical protein